MAQSVMKRSPVTGTAVERSARRRRPFLLDIYRTATGKKYAMAISGIALLGFVFFHMVGNLKMYFGPSDLNEYAHFLEKLLYPLVPEKGTLWLLRAGLIAMVLLHIHAAYSLTVLNRRARPVKYQSERDYQIASFASRTMRWTGIIVALFLLWHLADLTMGWVDPDYVSGNVYGNVVSSFSRVPVAALYVIAMIALGNHLYHGIWSIFQTVGSMNPRFDPRHNPLRRGFAAAFTIVVVGANISFPLAVQFGIVG